MRSLIILASLALAACAPSADQSSAARISEADAIAFLNEVPTALMARDVDAAVAHFTDDAVLIDPASNAIVTTREGNIAATNAFMSAGVTSFAMNSQRAQILDDDTFIVTTIVTARMAPGGAGPQEATFRFTDVVQKQADGAWRIVHEHASAAPEPLAEPLPVVTVIPAAAP